MRNPNEIELTGTQTKLVNHSNVSKSKDLLWSELLTLLGNRCISDCWQEVLFHSGGDRVKNGSLFDIKPNKILPSDKVASS